MIKLIEKIFEISDAIRYVSIYQDDKLISKQRPNITDASSSESDKYEELFVNPTILKNASQRGNLDCGGIKYIVIRYGNFFQLIREINNGHISICINKETNPIDSENSINEQIDSWS